MTLVIVFVYEISNNQEISVKHNQNDRFKTDGERITIQEVGLDDEGTYKCVIRLIPNKWVVRNKLTIHVKEWHKLLGFESVGVPNFIVKKGKYLDTAATR